MSLEEVRFLFVGLRLGLQLSPSVSKVVLRLRLDSRYQNTNRQSFSELGGFVLLSI